MKYLSKYQNLVFCLALLIIISVNTANIMKTCDKKSAFVGHCKQFYYTLMGLLLCIIVLCVFSLLRRTKYYNKWAMLAFIIIGAATIIYLVLIKDIFQCKNQKNLQKYCKFNLYVNFSLIGLLLIYLVRELMR